MDNKEEPKVHCIVLSKIPHELVKGDTEWKLCKVFSTISKSNQRIHREKNATRKYKPVVAFTVSNPSDTDRQTLNFNKGIVKDRLGFAVNCETVGALIDGIGDKETQWVLTTNDYLKHISVQENLTVDTFFENEFEESKVRGSLPSLFKLQSALNRTEVVLASPLIKRPTADDRRLKQLNPSSKGPCKPKNEYEREKSKEEKKTVPKVVQDLKSPKSERDLNRNHPAAQDYCSDFAQMVDIKVKESVPDYEQKTKLNNDPKRDHSARERNRFVITPKIKEEPPEYDYKPDQQSNFVHENTRFFTPKLNVKREEGVSEYDPVNENQTGAPSKIIANLKENVSEYDEIKHKNDQCKRHSPAEIHGKSAQKTISKRKENVPESDQGTGNRKHSGDDGIAKNISPKVTEVTRCGHMEKAFNEKLPVEASGRYLVQETIPQLRSDILVNYHKTKPNSYRKNDVDENCGSLEKVKKSQSHSKVKKRTSSDQHTPSPSKQGRPSTDQDSIVHKQPLPKCPSKEKRSYNYSVIEYRIARKSGPGTCTNDCIQDRGPSKLPLAPNPPQTSDSQTLKVVVPKLNTDVSKLKHHGEELIGKRIEATAVGKCSENKEHAHKTASQSAAFVTFTAETSHSPVKRRTLYSGKEDYGDIKKRKTTNGTTDSQSKAFQGKPQAAIFRSTSVESESTKTSKEFTKKISHEDKITDLKPQSSSEHAKGNDTEKNCILKKQGKPQPTTFRSLSVELETFKTPEDFAKKISHEDKIREMKSPSNAKQAKGNDTVKKGILKNQHTPQPTIFRSLSVESGSTKSTKKLTKKISLEDKVPNMKSLSKNEQGNMNYTVKKDILKNQGTPQPIMFRSLSVELGSTKTTKEFAKKISHEDKIPDMKSPSNSDPAKRNDTVKKGILRNPCKVDFKQNSKDHPSRTKKSFSFNESSSETNGQILHQCTTSQADSQSTGLDLLGSINTNESFLFTESEEQIGFSSLVEAVLHSDHYGQTDSNNVQTSNSVKTELMSKYQNTGKIPEMNEFCLRRGESNGEKRVETQSSNVPFEGPSQQQLNETRYVQQKSLVKVRSDVTLLVGDSMLQHIQPEKFFKTKHVVVKTVPGARVDNISDYITKFVRQENPSSVILHIGTNDLHKGTLHIAAHIESVGKLITETFPSVKKFSISSIIHRREEIPGANCAKTIEVNKTLKSLQLKHGWTYIDHEKLDPEVHVGPDGIHLNAIGIEAFAANIGKHLGLIENGLQHETSSSTLVSKDQIAVPVTSIGTGNSATSCMENSGEVFISGRKNVANKKYITLLAGDSMLESIKLQEDCGNKQVKRVVVPYARVDTFGDMVVDLAKHHKVDEVILHIGSNDLNDKVFTPEEIVLQIEQIGVDLEKTCPGITKITISGTISRNRRDADDVNVLLKSLQSKHGWAYICNDNVYPIFHNRPFDVKLKDPSAKVFEENIIKYLRPPDHTGTCSTDLQVAITLQENSNPKQKCPGKIGTPGEKDVTFATNISKHLSSDGLLDRKTNQLHAPKYQPVTIPEAAFEDTVNTATVHSEIRPEISAGKTNVGQRKVTLLIGDSMLQPFKDHKLSCTKETELVVVPDAKVDNIGKTISTHARNPNVDEVILHVGSNDLKDDVYNQNEIATKIEAIGMTLETTCPHIAAFTVSGTINTFQYKRSKCRNLNDLLRSLTSEHGWAYICNDNIFPTFHVKPFDTKLNSRGTTLFASNIIEHLRSVKSEGCRTASQASGVQGHGDHSSFKNTELKNCQEFVVHGKTNRVPQKYPKADKIPQKDSSHRESNDDALGSNAGTKNGPLDGQTGCSDQGDGHTEACNGTDPEPSRPKKGKRQKKNRKIPPSIPLVFPRKGVDKCRKRPTSTVYWPHGANSQDREHTSYNAEYSYARYSRSATHRLQQVRRKDILFPGYSGCYYCGELDHKKADCSVRF